MKILIARQRAILALPILISFMLAACAVQRIQAPQISPAAAWELNTADQLAQMQRDYLQLGTDVGKWQRAGQITPAQLSTINGIGDRLKPVLENGNRLFKSWQLTRAESTKLQIIAAVEQATQIFVELTTRKAAVAIGGN